MLLGKMIASACTGVVEKLKEGRNLRQPVPPGHSPATSCVPSNSPSTANLRHSREEGFWLPQSQKSHQGGPLQMFPANTTDSLISAECRMHASELLLVEILSSPNSATTSRRLKWNLLTSRKTITLAMLALMETEVLGPRLPGPMPFMTSNLLVTNQRKALHCVKYCSVEELDRLLPNQQAVQHGDTQQTTITGEGLTQESCIVNECPLD
jgi:hypothetical protein